MSTLKQSIIHDLESIISGDPWYGPSASEVLNTVDASVIHRHAGNAHSIAEVLIHMAAWTEEVAARLQGRIAADPVRGDWPDPSPYNWDALREMFLAAHHRLLKVIEGFPDEQLDNEVPYQREVYGVTFRDTLEGLSRHHTYHLGQISILNKLLSQRK